MSHVIQAKVDISEVLILHKGKNDLQIHEPAWFAPTLPPPQKKIDVIL